MAFHYSTIHTSIFKLTTHAGLSITSFASEQRWAAFDLDAIRSDTRNMSDIQALQLAVKTSDQTLAIQTKENTEAARAERLEEIEKQIQVLDRTFAQIMTELTEIKLLNSELRHQTKELAKRMDGFNVSLKGRKSYVG